MRTATCLVAAALAAGSAGCAGGDDGGAEPPPRSATPTGPEMPASPGATPPADAQVPQRFRRLPGITTGTAFGLGEEGLERWRSDVPRIRDVRIRSSADGSRQPALYLPPRGSSPRPLLVVLHSWSNGYGQHLGSVYARWADQSGWGLIAPEFRGPNVTAQATGSDLAVRDVVDAIDDAVRRGGVDADRVYVTGFSGGGMMSLLMAGRHPERVAGAVSWVPVHDLVDWHAYNASFTPQRDYAGHIVESCGGDPQTDAGARAACERRSPRRWLAAARRARVPVYLGHGIDDTLVRPSAAVRAFNQLADPRDRIGADAAQRIRDNVLPDRLDGSIETNPYFGEQDPEVRFARRSRSATIVLFEGEHDLVFNPGLEWLARLPRR